MKSRPAQQMSEETLQVVKQKKKPPKTARTRIVPQTSITQRMQSPESSPAFIVLMLQNEKMSKISHIKMKRGKSLKTSLICTLLLSMRSLAIKTKAVTQKTCPTKNASAPIPKRISYWLHRRHMSPTDPKKRPIMIVLICGCVPQTEHSWTIMSQIGTAFTYFKKLSIWSASPIRYKTANTTYKRSRTPYTQGWKKGFGCEEYIFCFFLE